MTPTIKWCQLDQFARIPTKNVEDAGYDVYALLEPERDMVIIRPSETKIINTGIACIINDDWCFKLEERSSIGSLGITLKCGVIDSGYRGEWHIAMTNTTKKTVHIARKFPTIEQSDWDIFIPYNKAICQALLLPVPKPKIDIIDVNELRSNKSLRGEGWNGSTGK